MVKYIILFLFPLFAFANNWDGHYYSSHSEMQFKMAMDTLQHVHFKPNGKVLDIGCGDGRISHHISTLTSLGEVVGVDNSLSMISKATLLAHDRLSFLLADVLHLPFDRDFHTVVSFNCLHWVVEIETALSEIHRALVKGGEVCILIAPVQERYPIHKIVESVALSPKWAKYFDVQEKIFHLYSFAEWTRLLKNAGFLLKQAKVMDGSVDYKNAHDFALWLGSWVPCGTIPENYKIHYFYDIAYAYLREIPPAQDGTVHFYLDELMLLAEKVSER